MFVAKLASSSQVSLAFPCHCVVAAEQGINIPSFESSVAWNILQILYIVKRPQNTFLEEKSNSAQSLSLSLSMMASLGL